MYRHIKVREAVAHWARLYPAPRDVDEVIALAGLEEKADALTRTLSGGQLRRLDLALALVGDPELIFLDEPTTGFDPAARRAAWDVVRSLRDLGKTILLTTHYLDEAQAARRPRRDHQGRPDPRHRRAERARRRRDDPGTASPGATSTASCRSREVEDPTRLVHELTSAALARGGSAARPHGHAPVAGGRLPRAHRRAAAGGAPCLRPRSPGASTASSAACSGATRRRRSSTSGCRCMFLALFGAIFSGDQERPRHHRPRHRRAGDHGDDVQRAGDEHDLPARGGRAQAHPRHAAARRRLPGRRRGQRGDQRGRADRDRRRRGQAVLRPRLAEGLVRARRLHRRRASSASRRWASRTRT